MDKLLDRLNWGHPSVRWAYAWAGMYFVLHMLATYVFFIQFDTTAAIGSSIISAALLVELFMRGLHDKSFWVSIPVWILFVMNMSFSVGFLLYFNKSGILMHAGINALLLSLSFGLLIGALILSLNATATRQS